MPFGPEQMREYQRNWTRKRRAEFLADKSCRICGSSKDLHVHHLEPEKKLSHRVWSWSAKRREEELAKCDILCAEHHNMIHNLMRRMEARRRNPCGTYGSYKRGCRCRLCRDANNRYRRELKARHELAETLEHAEAA